MRIARRPAASQPGKHACERRAGAIGAARKGVSIIAITSARIAPA
jgi:hypothetical protein